MNRNRNAHRQQRSTGRFGPYSEYEINRARGTLEALAFSSRSPRVATFLNKAYENDINWSVTDRVPFHFPKHLFPSPDEWSPLADVSCTEADVAVPGPSHEDNELSLGVKSSDHMQNSVAEENLYLVDRQGSFTNEVEEHERKELNERDNNEVIVIDELSDGETRDSGGNEDIPLNMLTKQVSSGDSEVIEYEEGEIEVYDESDAEVPEQYDRSSGEIVERLKCDLCSFHVKSEEEMKMKLHLNNEKHYGASLMEGYLYGDDFRPVYVSQEMKLRVNIDVSTLVPVCPVSVCSDIYPNIWSCAVHYQNAHQERDVQGAYGVGKVMESRMVVISMDPTCETCGMSFESQRALNAHWRSSMLHYPYPFPPSGQVTFFRCLYCQTIFSDFIAARSHIFVSHNDRASKSQGIRVVYVQKPQQKLYIPTPKPNQNYDWFENANHHAGLVSVTRKQPQNRFGKAKKKKKKGKKRRFSQAQNYQQY